MNFTKPLPREPNDTRWQLPCYDCGEYQPFLFMHPRPGPGYTCSKCFSTTQENTDEQHIQSAR